MEVEKPISYWESGSGLAPMCSLGQTEALSFLLYQLFLTLRDTCKSRATLNLVGTAVCENSYSDHTETEQERSMIPLFGYLMERQSLNTKESPQSGMQDLCQGPRPDPWHRVISTGSSTMSSWPLILVIGR